MKERLQFPSAFLYGALSEEIIPWFYRGRKKSGATVKSGDLHASRKRKEIPKKITASHKTTRHDTFTDSSECDAIIKFSTPYRGYAGNRPLLGAEQATG